MLKYFHMKDKLRAMVLAAGIGSRLAPLSDSVPKPLIRVGGRTIMEHILLLLKKHGIDDVISNTFHLADKIHDEFKNIEKDHGIKLKFVQEQKLSGVAGGIRECKDFLSHSTAVILMGDALTDVDLTALYEKHIEAVNKHNCLVTIAQMQVEDCSQFGVIVTESLLPGYSSNSDTAARVVQFQEKPSKEEALSNWANTGIYFFEPEVYKFIPSIEKAPKYDVASDLFPRLLEEGVYMQAISVNEDMYWADLGTPKQYIQSLLDVQAGKVNLDIKPAISESAIIDPSVNLLGAVEIGEFTQIAENVTIKDSIIWNNVHIGEGVTLENCIIGDNTIIDAGSSFVNKILVAENSLA
jgi:NDP-sugar pyrophosphorylase family protein